MPEKEYHQHNDGIFCGKCKEKHESDSEIIRLQISGGPLPVCRRNNKYYGTALRLNMLLIVEISIT